MMLINIDDLSQLTWPDYNHEICSYLDDRFPTKILSIAYNEHDGYLWIISNDSYAYRLPPLKTKNNKIKWNYENMYSLKIKERWPSLSLNGFDRIILMWIEKDAYFLMIRHNHNNITIFSLKNQIYEKINRIESINYPIEWHMFIDGEIMMNIGSDRLLIIKKNVDNVHTYQYYMFEIKIKTARILLREMGSIECPEDKILTNGTFCQMLAKKIVINFFDSIQWNFVDQNGQLYQLMGKNYFNDESLNKMANIDSIHNNNNIKTISEYFECYERFENNKHIDHIERDENGTIIFMKKPDKSEKTIVIVIAIAISIQLIVLLISIIWCLCCRHRQRRKQQQQQQQRLKKLKTIELNQSQKQQNKWSFPNFSIQNAKRSIRSIRFPIEMINRSNKKSSSFGPVSTTTTTTTATENSIRNTEFDRGGGGGTELTETIEMTEKSISKTNKNKRIALPKQQQPQSKLTKDQQQLASLFEKVIKKIDLTKMAALQSKSKSKSKSQKLPPQLAVATTTTSTITLSDYFGGNKDHGKKPILLDEEKTLMKILEESSTTTEDGGSFKRKRSIDDSLNEIQRNRKAAVKDKQKRREQQLLKVIKILAKDSRDFRKHRRLLRLDNDDDDDSDNDFDDDDDFSRTRTRTNENLIGKTVRSREATDPQLVRDLLDNLARHRERKRRLRLLQIKKQQPTTTTKKEQQTKPN